MCVFVCVLCLYGGVLCTYVVIMVCCADVELCCILPSVDVWAIGCIFAELVKGEILLPGRDCIHGYNCHVMIT